MLHVLSIHGGNAFDTYEEYLADLRKTEISLDRILAHGWKARLQQELGEEFQVISPRMPNEFNARYTEWKIWFEKLVALLHDEIILVGHSLGGIFLVKYLSENTSPVEVLATYLVAAPYNTPDNHPLVDFTVTTSLDGFQKQAGKIFLYHSTDDRVVPFENAQWYLKELPTATLRKFSDRGHFNGEAFPEIIEDIKTYTNI